MPKLVLEPFERELFGDEEPSEHQMKFLYLPLPIFRDYTNIRSIIIKYNRKKDGKPLKGIEINQKIKACHTKLGELDQWEELHLDELEFEWEVHGVKQTVKE